MRCVPPHDCITTGRRSDEHPEWQVAQVYGSGRARQQVRIDQGGMRIFLSGLSASHLSMPLSPPTRDVLNMAIRKFTAESEMQIMQQRESSSPAAVRDWGGWMDALPSLTSGSDNDILSPAIMALAASITTHGTGARPTKASYLGAYGTALRKLQIALRSINPSSRFMILATIICLYTAAVCPSRQCTVTDSGQYC